MRGERRRRYSFAERLRRIPATRMVRPRQARLTGESRVATWPRAVRRPFDHRTDATARRQGKSIQFGIVPGPTNVSPLQDSGLASRSDAGITAAPGDGTQTPTRIRRTGWMACCVVTALRGHRRSVDRFGVERESRRCCCQSEMLASPAGTPKRGSAWTQMRFLDLSLDAVCRTSTGLPAARSSCTSPTEPGSPSTRVTTSLQSHLGPTARGVASQSQASPRRVSESTSSSSFDTWQSSVSRRLKGISSGISWSPLHPLIRW